MSEHWFGSVPPWLTCAESVATLCGWLARIRVQPGNSQLAGISAAKGRADKFNGLILSKNLPVAVIMNTVCIHPAVKKIKWPFFKINRRFVYSRHDSF
jgi:hypothetical protein